MMCGLFSLAIPYRVGRDCEAYAREQQLEEANSGLPLKAHFNCLAAHRSQLTALWAGPIADTTSQRVDAWLADPSGAVGWWLLTGASA